MLVLAFTVVMMVMAIVGAIRNYSPIPWWDMWGGTLQFYMDVQDKNYSAWWKQHNEHRIVLARLLFWVDYRYFGGRSVFLIAMNYLFAGGAAVVFWRYLRESSKDAPITVEDRAVGLFVAASLFLWSQENNFTWGFQGQFFLAQLLPLSALLLLAESTASPQRSGKYMLACTLGVLSIGTMANGLLALPLMAVLALVLRIGAARVGLIVALSASGFVLYFTDYHSPGEHGTVMNAVREYPVGMLHYMLLYLGSPFHFLMGSGDFGRVGALLAGAALISGSAWLSWHSIRAPQSNAFTIALLLFVFYICGSGLAAGAGRFVFGIDGAVSSRYTTPAVMAWSALFVALHMRLGKRARRVGNGSIFFGMFLLGCTMVATQLDALKSMRDSLSSREIAALALALDIDDPAIIQSVYPASMYAIAVTRTAVDRKLSVFGQYPYAGLRNQLGTAVRTTDPTIACVGQLDRIEDIPGVTRFVRIQGWIYDSSSDKTPGFVLIADHAGLTVGYALTGAVRADVAKAIGSKALYAGFRGYMLANAQGAEFHAIGDQPPCLLAVRKANRGN